MHFKNYTRVMAALVCGAIVAGSASVSAFAGNTSGHQNAPIAQYTESRTLKLAPAEHGKVEVVGAYDGYAVCDSIVTIKLIPDAGYKAAGISTGEYVDQEIQGSDGVYTFKMPWYDPKTGITVTGKFAPVNGDDTKNEQDCAVSTKEDTEVKESTETENAEESTADKTYKIESLPTVDGDVVPMQWIATPGEEIVFWTEAASDYHQVTPYILSSKTNKEIPGTEVKFESNPGGGFCLYSFIMPAEDVVIGADFVVEPYGEQYN